VLRAQVDLVEVGTETEPLRNDVVTFGAVDVINDDDLLSHVVRLPRLPSAGNTRRLWGMPSNLPEWLDVMSPNVSRRDRLIGGPPRAARLRVFSGGFGAGAGGGRGK